ncbi:amidase [Brevibacterium sp. 50QC2O2]|uniref:amidase n=1 Tax=Brevibacterium sp. 50QC2O2 TaxID=2968459 RepID=UPI00211BC98B|nr:amidase [Brevibacterium sp. 50QC2O2]MCQ9387332.1 amidase [Brevibacterium sp. 50QC2O2]
MTELADYSAEALRAGFASGDFTPVDAVESVAGRIEACEPTLNALWVRTLDTALEQAAAAAARWRAGAPLGPLDGVPVTVKENIARSGIPMPAGHAAGTPPVPEEDAPITARLAEAGALIVGSTVMPDWGMLSSGVSSRHGITRSPLNPELTTGGSSAGAGAAAAAGYGPIHIGTDIGGSIRLPGTWLGLATLKPSFGRVPLAAPYLGRCAGPLARRVADVVAAMDVIGRADGRDYSELPPYAGAYTEPFEPAELRVAVHTDAGCGLPTDPEVAAAVDAAADLFAAAGATVTRIEPFMDGELLGHTDVFLRARSWGDLKALPVHERSRILPYIRQWCLGGADATGQDVFAAYHAIQEMRERANAVTHSFDLVLSPVAPMAAFPADWPMPWGDDADRPMVHIGYTLPYNMGEQPAATVNAGYTGDGRTIGLQIAGARFADARVLAAAAWYEAAAAVPVPVPVIG